MEVHIISNNQYNNSNNNIRTDTGDFINPNSMNSSNQNQFNSNNPISLDFTELQFNVMHDIRSKLLAESTGRKFNKQQIRQMLNNPKANANQIRQASLYLAVSSSHYMRLLFYMSSMLTLDHILTPINITSKDVKKKAFKDNYRKANDYVNNFNIKHELLNILLILMIEDVYFGYERSTSKSFMLQRLPTERCRIIGKEDGIFTFEFDFSYFVGKEDLLNNYDREFITLYNKYRRTNQPWQLLNTKKSVCLN